MYAFIHFWHLNSTSAQLSPLKVEFTESNVLRHAISRCTRLWNQNICRSFLVSNLTMYSCRMVRALEVHWLSSSCSSCSPVMALWEAFQAWALTQDKHSPAREGQMLLRSCQNDTAASLKVAANRRSIHGFEAGHDVTRMLCDAVWCCVMHSSSFFFAGCSVWPTSVALITVL